MAARSRTGVDNRWRPCFIETRPIHQPNPPGFVGRLSPRDQRTDVQGTHGFARGEPVAKEPQAEQLGNTRQFVVVLGLVIDRVGRVLYGEVVDPQRDGRYRFIGLDGIPTAVSDWLREVRDTQRRDES